MNSREYASPAAFRRALTDKLKALAANGKWNLAQLQRQIAYDRLLERLYLANEGWVVKGATALLAREIGVRATIDVDLYRELAGRPPNANCAKPSATISVTGSDSKPGRAALLPQRHESPSLPTSEPFGQISTSTFWAQDWR